MTKILIILFIVFLSVIMIRTGRKQHREYDKLKERGIQADAVVTDVEAHRLPGADDTGMFASDPYEYYCTVSFVDNHGCRVEKSLTGSTSKRAVGDKMKILYVPDDPEMNAVYPGDYLKGTFLWDIGKKKPDKME